mgnify:CR=1 FL=1
MCTVMHKLSLFIENKAIVMLKFAKLCTNMIKYAQIRINKGNDGINKLN